jgi:hypothetical protein
VLCCTGRLEDNQASLVGATQGASHMDIRERNDSLERIETILTPYRQPIKGRLDDKEYLEARKSLESIAQIADNSDPTEAC